MMEENEKLKKIKDDILSFFNDKKKVHWIYQYGENKYGNVDRDSVFYKTQMKILFENKHYHWNTDKALNQLIEEGELIRWEESTENGIGVVLIRRKDLRYYSRKTQKILELIDYYSDRNLETGKWGEFITEHMFLQLKFDIIDDHTNKFQGKKWTKTKHDLDLIISKDDINYGIEVKNRFEYIGREEFNIKMYDICSYLDLVPVIVTRMIPRFLINELYENGGFAIVFKRKAFPIGQKEKIKELWANTLLPVGSTDILTRKGKENFYNWHQSL